MIPDYEEIKVKLKEVLEAVGHEGLVIQRMLMEIFSEVTGKAEETETVDEQ